jgi:hypothetical protein
VPNEGGGLPFGLDAVNLTITEGFSIGANAADKGSTTVNFPIDPQQGDGVMATCYKTKNAVKKKCQQTAAEELAACAK